MRFPFRFFAASEGRFVLVGRTSLPEAASLLSLWCSSHPVLRTKDGHILLKKDVARGQLDKPLH